MSFPGTLVTAEQLRRLFPNLTFDQVARYHDPLERALLEFSIDTPLRLAGFLAQIGHESAGLTRWEESFRYSPARLLEVFNRDGRVRDLAHAQQLVEAGPEAIAEAVYGAGTKKGRELGNTEPGDGFRYRGRGPLQHTGRANYLELAIGLGLPLVVEPERLRELEPGFRAAGLFWKRRGCNELADAADLVGMTKRVNGGLNGLQDRGALWQEARRLFSAPATRHA